jgi:hypothetical protein
VICGHSRKYVTKIEPCASRITFSSPNRNNSTSSTTDALQGTSRANQPAQPQSAWNTSGRVALLPNAYELDALTRARSPTRIFLIAMPSAGSGREECSTEPASLNNMFTGTPPVCVAQAVRESKNNLAPSTSSPSEGVEMATRGAKIGKHRASAAWSHD